MVQKTRFRTVFKNIQKKGRVLFSPTTSALVPREVLFSSCTRFDNVLSPRRRTQNFNRSSLCDPIIVLVL